MTEVATRILADLIRARTDSAVEPVFPDRPYPPTELIRPPVSGLTRAELRHRRRPIAGGAWLADYVEIVGSVANDHLGRPPHSDDPGKGGSRCACPR